MAQPPAYNRATQFAQEERDNAGGRSTVRTAAVDAELDGISQSINALRTVVALNQRDDGEIRDGRVKLFTLGSDVLSLLVAQGGATPRGNWTTATTYALKDVVAQGGNTYICAVPHTSGVFATDLAAVKWLLLALGSTPNASGLAFSPTGTIAATNVQDAINESDTEVRALITNLQSQIVNLEVSVSNIAALRLRLDTGSTAIQVQGYYSPGDGGGGMYWPDPSDLTSADNGATIIVGSITGMRWKLFRTTALNVRQFGAKGDGVTDDTNAILNAITLVGPRELYWLRGTYLHTSMLVMPVNQSWRGPGGQRAVILKKGFNGDSISVTDTNTIRDIDVDGNAVSFTGRGIVVGAGFSHYFERVRVHDTYDESLDFANNAGAGSQIIGSEFGVTTIGNRNLTVAAIKMRDNTACPRFFSGVWLSGGLLDIQSGGNGATFQCFYIGNLKTDSSSALFHMAGGRVASIAASTILQGSDVQITNVSFSGPVFLQNAQGILLSNNTYGAGCFITDANSQYCSFDVQAQTYTPTWTQASGTQPVLNNGTLTGFFNRNGYTAKVHIELTMGSTTTYGNNLTAYRFSLPYRGHLSYDQKHIPVEIFDFSSNTTYTVWGEIGQNTDVITLGLNGQSVRDGFPFTWGTGDKITMNFEYIAR